MLFRVEFSLSNQRIPATFKDLQTATSTPDVKIYDGDYEVTPKVDSQTIPTAQKFLTDDMRIKAIPFYNVSNTTGGSTVFIGKELE